MSFLRVSAVAVVLALLAACGGGAADAGDGLILGQSQDPDPVVIDVPFAYIRRQAPEGMAFKSIDPRQPLHFQPGADLIVADRAAPDAPRVNVSRRAFVDAQVESDAEVPSTWDVRDLNVSPDGRLLVFAMRAPAIEDADDDEQPTWNLWTYDPAADLLTRVFSDDADAEAGEDVMPAFLPDGRIVFASTRQRRARAILLDEGKPQYSRETEAGNGTTLNLHVVDPTGANLRQITFNPSHDLSPSVLQDGRLVYVRWDRAPGNDGISIYRTDPDGHGNELLYGFHSHEVEGIGQVEFGTPRALPDGRLLVRLQSAEPMLLGQADLLIVDPEAFTDLGVPVATNAGASETAFKRLVPREVRLDEQLSRGGRYLDAWPLFDGTGRLLVSWSQCRQVLDETLASCVGAGEDAVEAEPVFSIFVYDPADDTQLPLVVPQTGVAFTDPVALAPVGSPVVRVDAEAAGTLDADLVAAEAGVLDIRSVYDIGGEDTSEAGYRTLADPALSSLADRPVAFVRLLKQVSPPPRAVIQVPRFAFGPQRNLGQREILGYAPVHPDGSVRVKVPADVPFTLELLDASGARVHARRQYWLDVRPGEVLGCNGCHEAGDTRPHGRIDAEPQSINAGGPFVNVNAAIAGMGGQTLAQAFAERNGVPDPDFDVRFEDVWTDPAVRLPDAAFAFDYAALLTAQPVTSSCAMAWSARCRAVIHYAEHIQPLFDLPRVTLDVDGVTVLEDHTCTGCHAPVDGDGLAMVPAAQLELTAAASDQNPDQMVGYRELLFGDNEQELVDGVLLDRLVQATDAAGNLLFETDEDGELILDAEGMPIPVLVPVRVSPPARAAGALASTRLFAPFAPGGSHEGYLSGAELRLLREWLDIGAQYLNDPFAVEAN